MTLTPQRGDADGRGDDTEVQPVEDFEEAHQQHHHNADAQQQLGEEVAEVAPRACCSSGIEFRIMEALNGLG
jgi:hypothetical protein